MTLISRGCCKSSWRTMRNPSLVTAKKSADGDRKRTRGFPGRSSLPPIAIEGSELRPGKPRVLFRSPSADFFAVTKDGFLMVRQLDLQQPREISVILNWKRELLR